MGTLSARKVYAMPFPVDRGRRLRRTESLRRLVAETRLSRADLIYPLFVQESITTPRQVPSMPGVFQMPVAELPVEAERIARLGIPAVLLFGLPAEKDETGSSSWGDEGIVQQAVRTIKRAVPDLVVITDVCLCEYTSHGHCGVLRGQTVDNDATLPLLA